MLNSVKKINILTLVLSEKKILNETKNHVIDLHPGSNCILFIELFTNRHVKIFYLHIEINKRIQLFTQNMFHIISVNTACVDVD
jgi:hypothetical protein